MDGSWWRVLKTRGTLEKGTANHFSIRALRTSWTVQKRKKDTTLKDKFPRSVDAQYGQKWRNNYRKNEERRQSENKAHLWVWLVMKVKSSAIKNTVAWKPGMLGPWVKVNWKWLNRRCKSKHWHFGNQWTKMDRNGQIYSRSLYLLLWAKIP